MNEIEKYNTTIFESIKHIDENGLEYWEARELMKVLEYNKWENFHKVIKKSMISCEVSNNNVLEHFPEFRKPIKGGNGNVQNVLNYKLSRYACYLIVQTEAKLKNDKVNNENDANDTHYEVGSAVRDTIKKLGGTMPEDLPTPEKSIEELQIDKLKELQNN